MSKLKDFFKPEDFCKDNWTAKFSDEMAKISNEKLNALIESWSVVYGTMDVGESNFWSEGFSGSDTHKARLAFIEEIVKEPCKHEPAVYLDGLNGERQTILVNFCIHCGVELQATWSEKK